jgi:hypothetical protein
LYFRNIAEDGIAIDTVRDEVNIHKIPVAYDCLAILHSELIVHVCRWATWPGGDTSNFGSSNSLALYAIS